MIKVYTKTVNKAYELDLSKMGLSFLSLNVDSLESNLEFDKAQGVDGQTLTENTFSSRKLNGKLFLRAKNNIDFQNKKSEVYQTFNSKNELLLVDERLTRKKVWRVFTTSNYIINNDETSYTKTLELEFLSLSPFAESLLPLKHTINTTATSTIFIDTDVDIDPRVDKFQLEFFGISKNLRIVNETTNTSWQYKKDTIITDKIEIDGLECYKNNINIINDTTLNVLTFNKGDNKIKVYGTTGDFSLNFIFYPLFI